jgi:NitT/TauT family transport system substrate-binding protein
MSTNEGPLRGLLTPARRSRRQLGIVGVVLLCCALLAGCGSKSEASGSSGGLTKVDVGVLPLAAVAPVYLGIDKGFFKEEGLQVTPKQAQGGAALIPAVLSGDMQFAYVNNTSVVLAQSKGLPVQVVANGNDEATDVANANSTVVTRKGSPIKKPADLAGKTIAVNTLNNVGDMTIKASLERHGVDVSGLKFLELPFPDMMPALERGSVDAVWLVTPFTETAAQAGAQVVLRPFYETKPGLSIASYMTSKKYAAQNPKVVAAFARAMDKSEQYAQAHEDELRAAVSKFTTIPDAVLKVMPLPEFSTELPRDSLELTAELMAKYKMVDKAPKVEDLLWHK